MTSCLCESWTRIQFCRWIFFFKKIQSYFEITYLIKNVKIFFAKSIWTNFNQWSNIIIVFFKFWQRVKTFADDEIKIFENIFESNIAILLLNQKFINVNFLFYEIRKIEQNRKKINQKFEKQQFEKAFAKTIFSISNSFNRVVNKPTTNIINVAILIISKSKTITSFAVFARKMNKNFLLISIKSAK